MIIAEGGFAEAEKRHAHRKARWRGLEKMQIQSHLVAVVQNLKKLLKHPCKPARTGMEILGFSANDLKFVVQRAKLLLVEAKSGLWNRNPNYC